MWIACRTVFGWKFMERLPKLAEWVDYEPVITEHVTQSLPANSLARMKILVGRRVGLRNHDHGSDVSGESPAPYGTRPGWNEPRLMRRTMHRKYWDFTWQNTFVVNIRGDIIEVGFPLPQTSPGRSRSIQIARHVLLSLSKTKTRWKTHKKRRKTIDSKSLLNETRFAAISEWRINRKSLDKAEDYKFLCIMSLRSKSRAMLVIPFMIWSLQRAWNWLKWSCRQ